MFELHNTTNCCMKAMTLKYKSFSTAAKTLELLGNGGMEPSLPKQHQDMKPRVASKTLARNYCPSGTGPVRSQSRIKKSTLSFIKWTDFPTCSPLTVRRQWWQKELSPEGQIKKVKPRCDPTWRQFLVISVFSAEFGQGLLADSHLANTKGKTTARKINKKYQTNVSPRWSL